MAQNSTIHKAELGIADIDRGYYRDHALTIAQHPSETAERMMVRLLAFAMYADDALAFGAGLSSADEPDLWVRDLTGAISCWIDVGLPDERRLRKACGRAARVVVVTYGRNAPLWWTQQRAVLQRLERLEVVELPADATRELAALARRAMRLQINAHEGVWWIGSDDGTVSIEPRRLLGGERG